METNGLLDDSVHVLDRDERNGANYWEKVLRVLYEGGWLAEKIMDTGVISSIA